MTTSDNTFSKDPTELTTDAVLAAKEDLRREIREAERLRQIEHTTLRDLVFAAIENARGEREGIRRALELNDKRIEEVMTERFSAVNQRFVERDTRTEQAAQESRISLDAALAAAKEAVGEQNKSNTQSILKSETSTTKLIDGLQTLIQTNTDATNDKIADIRTRLDRGEGTTRGEDRSGARVLAESASRTARVGLMVATGGMFSYLVYLLIAVATKGKF